MIFGTGPLNVFKCTETVIGLGASPDGQLLASVSLQGVTVWKGGQENWVVVGVVKHVEELTGRTSRCQIAWKTDATSFIVVYTGEVSCADIFKLEPTTRKGVALTLPRWSITGSTPLTHSIYNVVRTASLAHVGEDPKCQVTAVASNRFRALIGTSCGTIMPVLWSGEVVKEREMNILKSLGNGHRSALSGSLSQLSIGFDQRVAFLTDSGGCGVFKHNDARVSVIEDSGCSAISLSFMRSMLLVGRDEEGEGDIAVYAFVEQQVILVRHVRLASIGLRTTSAPLEVRVDKLAFCTDNAVSCFAASYKGLGIVLWSLNGSKMASTLQEVPSGKNTKEDCSVVDFSWVSNGFSLIGTGCAVSDPSKSHNGTKVISERLLWQMELMKLSVPAYSPRSDDCIALVGNDYVKILGTRDWDTHCLEWQTLRPPKAYLRENWPIRYLAISPDKTQVALSGKHGAVLFNRSTGRWRLFGNINTEKSIICSGLFWYNSNIVCIINREAKRQKDTFSLLFYPRSHLDDYSRLACFGLPGRPVSLDIDIANNCLVVQYKSVLEVYHIACVGKGTNSSTSPKDAGTVEITVKKARSIPLTQELVDAGLPSLVQLLPCGFTRTPGSLVKLPKCICLNAIGKVFVLDTEQSEFKLLATNIERVMTSSWSNFQNSLKSNPVLLSKRTTVNIPGAVLFSVWLCDGNGLKLWLPALDFDGAIVENACAYFEPEVLPAGIIESHGVAVGVTQRRGVLPGGGICFQVGMRIQPAVHCLLHWLLRAQKFDLGSDVLVQASQRLSLFQESVELLIHGAVENDNGKPAGDKLLPSVLRLLRQGKATMIIPNQFFAAIVASCARKLEASRWNYLFDLVGSPEQFFNECIYYGQLRTASYFLLIADHYSPEKAKARLSALRFSAEEREDTSLLKEIEHYEALRSRTIDGSY